MTMSSKISSTSSYDGYYEMPEVTYENEEIKSEVFDPGEYVLEKKKTKDSDKVVIPIPGKGKPGHKPTKAGVYDDLYDYNTNPQPSVVNSNTNLLEGNYGWSMQRKIFVWCILGVVVVGATAAGVIYSILGSYIFMLFRDLRFRISFV